MSWVFTVVAGLCALKGPLAVSGYPAPCLLMGEVMLTLFELGSQVCVTSVPMVLPVLTQERDCLLSCFCVGLG